MSLATRAPRARTLLLAAGFSLLGFQAAFANGPLAIRDTPLFITDNVAPFNMLVVGRDHKLYYEAYNDASDLNGDGVLDVGFKPAISYYGYFDSDKCYDYASGGGRFEPSGAATDRKCSGNWSGNWLNYVTTARIDALRKVLYGGRRSTDTGSETVLERTHVPQDAHSWGKEYTSVSADGYDIKDYTPLSAPTAGMRHLFANTTPVASITQEPLLRVLQNRPERIWEWVSIERPVAGTELVSHPGTSVTPTDYVVRAKVCVAGMPESNCKLYPNGKYKPTGLLQDYGETDTMLFGLLSGSYENNTQGGVLRKRVSSIKDEIDQNDGHFLNTDPGIIRTLNGLKTTGFTGGFEYTDPSDRCGWITTRPIQSGECRMWGNPTGEMLYETLRYFAGKGAPTGAFDISTNGIDTATLGLSHATWDNPYSSGTSCAKPFATVISDINPSYDTDQVPGSAFSTFTGDVSDLNAKALADKISSNEPDVAGKHFIGQSGATYDGAPTPKTVSSLGDIRGLSPEDPTKEGGYYSASVAYFGLTHDLNPATGNQKMQTFSVALASPLPRIEIPVNGKTVTLVPFAKSVGGCLGVNGTQGSYQPTNQIVDFYVESISPTAGRFRVNFEDVEQGADHDMDAIAFYDYKVVGTQVEVTVTSQYAAGCITQHMGYVISGTSQDGIYLEVRDVDTNGAYENGDNDYFLDTPTDASGNNVAWNDGTPLPLIHSRTFTPSGDAAATILKDPLWYAAKWGGFKDLNNNGIPDTVEWDSDANGTPDNYFLVTNALTLKQQLSNAFDEIIARTGSASSAAVNSGSITDNTRLYQALFSTGDWSGSFVSFPVSSDGSLGSALWDAANLIPAPDSRRMFTTDDSHHAVTFKWDNLGSARQALLQPTDTKGSDRVAYLRGDRTKEVRNGGAFRNRNPSTVLGDIVDSAPVFVGQPPFRYSDSLEAAAYSTFKKTARTPMLYVGANDGMLHALNADDGKESWTFIPDPVFKNLIELTKPTYQHRYFVDGSPSMGDAFYDSAWHTVLLGGLNNGGQGIYALDITNPTTDTEAQAAARYLWEFTDRTDTDLGLTYSKPVITRMKSGQWAAIFGNGYNNTVSDGQVSSSGNAVLYIVDVKTGGLLKKIDTKVGKTADPLGQGRPNGLASAAVVDVEGDGVADYVYAGDLFGNMWKFNVKGSDASTWKVAYSDASSNPAPVFVAVDSSNRRQPITSKPSVTGGLRGVGMMVLFGTGKFMELNDRNVSLLKPQAFYGIWDKNGGTSTDIVTRDLLTQQTIDAEVAVPVGDGTSNIRITSRNAAGSGARGWYLDLISPGNTFRGEMQVSNSVLRNQRVVFSTLIPNADPCGFGGTSYLMDMDVYSGARNDFTPFDLNRDGQRTSADMVTVTVGGVDITASVTGVESSVGITGSAAIVTNAQGTLEYQYQTGTGSANGGANANTGDGKLTKEDKFAPPGALGRQSWRQLR